MPKDQTPRLRCSSEQYARWSAHAERFGFDSFSSFARRALDAVVLAQERGLVRSLQAMTPDELAVLAALALAKKHDDPE